MNRLRIAILLLVSSAAFAGTGDPVPLCPVGSLQDCVVPNWGVIEPDGANASIAPHTNSSMATAPAGAPRIAVQRMPVAATTDAMTQNTHAAIKAVVSPKNLFSKETDALTTALKRARFTRDGTIAIGEAAIRKAAAEALRKAGRKYFLTIYLKVPQTLSPDEGVLLDKKVRSINDVLVGARYPRSSDKPKT